MSFVDKLKSFIGYSEDEYYDDYVTEDNLAYDNNIDGGERVTDYLIKPTSYQSGGYGSDENENSFSSSIADSNKIVNIHTNASLKVVLVKPERFEDASSVADHLNAKRTVVLNLEAADKEVTRRLIDFLSGVAYANNGQIKRVASSTYIITPYNVDIMGDLLDELENSGAFF